MNNELKELYELYNPLKNKYDEMENLTEEIEKVIKELKQKKTDISMKLIEVGREVFDLNSQIIELEKDMNKLFTEDEINIINKTKEELGCIELVYKNTELKYLRANQYNDEGYFIGEKEKYDDKYIRHTFHNKEKLVKMIKAGVKELLEKEDTEHPFLKKISKKEYVAKHLIIMVYILNNLYDTK